MDKLRPFGHLLFGGNSIVDGGSSDTSYAFRWGLDVGYNDLISIRLGLADYVRTHHGDRGQNDFRFSIGIILDLAKSSARFTK